MTLSELRARALTQAGEQYQNESADEALLTGYINEGLAGLCNGRLPGSAAIEIVGGAASLEDIRGLTSIETLLDANGDEALFSVRRQTVYARDGAYTLIYLASPVPLRADDDAPRIPEEYHGALADYATGRLLGNGGKTAQGDAGFYLSRYQLSCAACDRWMDAARGPTRLRHKYW